MTEPEFIRPTSIELEACRAWCKGTGWLGEDSTGRRVPCLVHKPHLRAGTYFTNDVDPKSRHPHLRDMPGELAGR